MIIFRFDIKSLLEQKKNTLIDTIDANSGILSQKMFTQRFSYMVSENIVIINKLGLHARAAAKFVNTATKFESKVKIAKDDRAVDGKSIMSVMMLAASCGTTITLEADGPDETDALSAIKELINDKFGEGE